MDYEPLRFAVGLVERSSVEIPRKMSALASLAGAAARGGDCELAITILGKVTHPELRAFAIERVAGHCPAAHHMLREAREIILQSPLRSDWAREYRKGLLVACLEAGVFDEALAVCESFEWPLDQAQGMAELIERLGTTRPRRDALELLLRARQMVATLDDAEDRDGVLSQVANAYSTLGATEEWREVLGRIQRPDYRMTVLAARVGRTDDLWEEMLSTGRDAMSRADASCLAWAFDDAIAACLTMGRMDAAGEFLAMLPEGPWKDSQRRKICEALMKSGELQRAQQLAGEIQAPYARALMYGALARVYRKDGIAEKTLEMLRCAADSVPYLGPIATDLEAIGVVDLGTLLSKNGFEKEGAECARQAQTWLCRVHTYYRARPFIRLAHEATLAGDRDRAKEAMESAGLVANDTYSFAAMAAQYEAMGLSVAAARAVERMVESCEPDPALRMSTLQQIAEEYRAAGQRFSAEVASLLERLT